MKKDKFKIVISLIASTVLIVGLFLIFKEISVETLTAYKVDNQLLAILLFMIFYAIKGISVFFPFPVLVIASSIVFVNPWIALLVNFMGVFVCTTVPYLIGYKIGEKGINHFVSKYDKVNEIYKLYNKNTFFYTLIIRLLGLPMDLVSAILGSMRCEYKKYIFGTLLGMAPMTISLTFLGINVLEPKSPEFIISLIITGVVLLSSGLLYYFVKKYSRRIKMKIAIIFDSNTGNTLKIAEAMKEVVEEHVVAFGKPRDYVEADVLFIGSWTNKGNFSDNLLNFIKQVENKKIVIFGTTGFGGSQEYYDKLKERVVAILPANNEIIDAFYCQGKMSMAIRDRYVSLLHENPDDKDMIVNINNFDEALLHPNEEDCRNAKNFALKVLGELR